MGGNTAVLEVAGELRNFILNILSLLWEVRGKVIRCVKSRNEAEVIIIMTTITMPAANTESPLSDHAVLRLHE